MPRSKRAAWSALAVTAALITSSALTNTTADAAAPAAATKAKKPTSDTRNVGPDYNGGKPMSLDRASIRRAKSRIAAQAAVAPVVGASQTWLANDDTDGSIYLKNYTLRGIGDHIQVWVAQDTAFPAGDCRNTLGLSEVTDAQVNSFVHEFDTNIYPTESAAFSVPPSRDGTGGAELAEQIGEDADYWKVDADKADDIVVLVDNVKDANFYDPGTPDGQTYIAGFFYSVFNEYLDRNIMTIDAYDWLHRTGANPPDNSADQAYKDCATSQGSNRPYGAAKPHLYEGTFAHEYQHLLEYYADPDETAWVNEGLSDWAQTLVGYVDPSIAPDAAGADGHLACIQGFSDPAFGGAENSLTEWGDQGGPEILCDYGAAYSFMEYLQSHYGNKFMKKLHLEGGNGLVGLDKVLTESAPKIKGKPGPHKTAMQTLHDWNASLALDSFISWRGVRGGLAHWLSIKSMKAKINWDNAQDYNTPGAPPNGADYVRLRKANGSYYKASELRSVTFNGASTLEPDPVEWTEVANPPSATTEATTCGDVPTGTGPAALYSGCGESLDRSITRQVAVPSTGATLTFDALWDIEEDWDFGFAQVSADGGKTWKSLATADTTTDADPGADPAAVSQLPGFSGDSGTWKSQTADLSAYAGKNVLIGFRYITDTAVNEGGFWVRNIKVGSTEVPSTLAGWKTISQVNPTKVAGYTVQLIGYDSKGHTAITRIPLNKTFDGKLSVGQLFVRLGLRPTTVAALVTQDDPKEVVNQQARYSLKVNGNLQPGG
ncbi:hypothetical protein ABIE44_003086 [Marmoricola sp. OAE513]|uniref:peptidase M6 n=1 Tax=Marmoricola sp. OAE513 TaxID=2817894 RepID=UPI001D2EBA34